MKKKHPSKRLITQLQNKQMCAVHDSKHFYFNTVLPNFIKNAPAKFWDT